MSGGRGLLRGVALALVFSLLTPPLAAQVTLNLKDADIQTLVATVAEITGKNFVIDPRVRGRVSLISAKPLGEEEIYDVFLSILATHGFAAVPGDKVIKIVPSAGVKQAPIPTVSAETTAPAPEGGEDQPVTRVIEVENTAVDQLVAILRPLLPPEAHLAAYAGANVLVVSDSYANVERISDIVRRIDGASDSGVERLRLAHAPAAEVADLLQTLAQGRQQGNGAIAAAAGPVRVVADARSNSVLLSGSREQRRRLLELARELDSPPAPGGNTEVIYLRYAKAPELVEVLAGVGRQLTDDDGAGDGNSNNLAPPSDDIDIQADAATNALIITATPDQLSALRGVIERLDIRRAQVLIEAVIAEVSSEKVAELGVQWLLDGSKAGSAAGFSNFDNPGFNGLSLGELAGAVASQRLPGSLPSGAALALGDFSGSVRFGALISALAGDADTNVLSTPNLVTLDNEEAEIVVGQNVPFVTGTFTTEASDGGVNNPFQTIERRDVGLTLRVRPQINEGNALQLQITQELSSVVQSANALAQGPTTNKRAISTNVLLEDGQVLVLGGLIDDNLSETVQKIPGLGDIPVLGNLFRYRQTAKEKRNLMIFIHPVILRDPQIGSARSADKYRYMRRQQLDAARNDDGLLPELPPPLLKPQAQVHADDSLIGNGEPLPAPPPVTETPPAADSGERLRFGGRNAR